jgi:3-methyladenine DNA glycosylase Tag
MLFEFIILEGAQTGLSWMTILKKRQNYRKAFDGGISKSHACVVAAGSRPRIPSDTRMMKPHDRISLVTGPGENGYD